MEGQDDILDDLLYEWQRFRESRKRLEKLVERANRLGAGGHRVVTEIKKGLECERRE